MPNQQLVAKVHRLVSKDTAPHVIQKAVPEALVFGCVGTYIKDAHKPNQTPTVSGQYTGTPNGLITRGAPVNDTIVRNYGAYERVAYVVVATKEWSDENGVIHYTWVALPESVTRSW